MLYAYLDLRTVANLTENRDRCVATLREELMSLQRCACRTLTDLKSAFPWLPDELSMDTIKKASELDPEI